MIILESVETPEDFICYLMRREGEEGKRVCSVKSYKKCRDSLKCNVF
jgi:hypothetical protein